eukprot:3296982-Pleurochrysis_carterae.AAC.2
MQHGPEGRAYGLSILPKPPGRLYFSGLLQELRKDKVLKGQIDYEALDEHGAPLDEKLYDRSVIPIHDLRLNENARLIRILYIALEMAERWFVKHSKNDSLNNAQQRDTKFTTSASVVGGASDELEALRSQQQKDAGYFPTSSSNQSTAFREKRSTPHQHQLLMAPVMSWKRCWPEEQEHMSGVGTGRSDWHMRQFPLCSLLAPKQRSFGLSTPPLPRLGRAHHWKIQEAQEDDFSRVGLI